MEIGNRFSVVSNIIDRWLRYKSNTPLNGETILAFSVLYSIRSYLKEIAKYTMANIVILQLWKLKEGQISSLCNLEVD
jgi:hypothetical protein